MSIRVWKETDIVDTVLPDSLGAPLYQNQAPAERVKVTEIKFTNQIASNVDVTMHFVKFGEAAVASNAETFTTRAGCVAIIPMSTVYEFGVAIFATSDQADSVRMKISAKEELFDPDQGET